MYCKKCGNTIDEDTIFCPHCGEKQEDEPQNEKEQIVEQTPVEPTKKSYNIFAVIGFAVAIISLFLNFFGLVGIAALIVSIIGYKKIEETAENGKRFAFAGMIIGAISVLYGFFTIL